MPWVRRRIPVSQGYVTAFLGTRAIGGIFMFLRGEGGSVGTAVRCLKVPYMELRAAFLGVHHLQ
jgi:hypothetical protein